MEQREGRAHRIGQKSNVTVYKLITQNSIDEYVLKVLHKKQKMSEEMLDVKTKMKKVKISKSDIKKILEVE
jgi:SNF2 family DNA or RNA helicase